MESATLACLKLSAIRVISLARSPERKVTAARAMELMGAQGWEYFEAFDAKKHCTTTLRFEDRPGVFGVWMSHYLLLTEAIARGWESLAIFEDDITVADNFAEQMEVASMVLATSHAPDVLLLGWQPHKSEAGKKPVAVPYVLPELMVPQYWHGAYGMILSRRAMVALLEELKDGFSNHVDVQYCTFLREHPTLKILAFVKPIVLHPNIHPTTIQRRERLGLPLVPPSNRPIVIQRVKV